MNVPLTEVSSRNKSDSQQVTPNVEAVQAEHRGMECWHLDGECSGTWSCWPLKTEHLTPVQEHTHLPEAVACAFLKTFLYKSWMVT